MEIFIMTEQFFFRPKTNLNKPIENQVTLASKPPRSRKLSYDDHLD